MRSRKQSIKSSALPRRLVFESLESRLMLAYGDSFRDLESIDFRTPHVPFAVINEQTLEPNGSPAPGIITGLSSTTDEAIIINGSSDYFGYDDFRFSASRGDIVTIFSSVDSNNLPMWINGTYPIPSSVFGSTFDYLYVFRAPSNGEFVFGVGPSFAGPYKLGVAIVPNRPVVAEFTGTFSTTTNTTITLRDASGDPEEKVLGGTGITQRQWSGGGGTGTTARYTFTSAGTYSVSLTVVSNDGETDSVTHSIVVTDPVLPTGGKLHWMQYMGSAVPILPDPGLHRSSFDDPTSFDYYDANADGNADEKQPVLYAAGSVPTVDATFKMLPGASGQYLVRGTAPDGMFFEGSGTVSNGLLTVENMSAKSGFGGNPKQLEPQIRKHADFTVNWQLSANNGATWTSGGASQNTLYVSAAPSWKINDGDSATSNSIYETVVDVAITRNLGLTSASSDRQLIIDGTWTFFDMLTSDDARRLDGMPLSYWGDGYDTPANQYSKDILSGGTGKCGGWVRFFLDILAVNGVLTTGIQESEIEVRAPSFLDVKRYGLLVQEIDFFGPGPWYLDTTFTNVLTREQTTRSDGQRGLGLAAQHNDDPVDFFSNHALVEIGNFIYDPSYGKRFNSYYEWEEASLAGFAREYSGGVISELQAGDLDGRNGNLDTFYVSGLFAIPKTTGEQNARYLTKHENPDLVTSYLPLGMPNGASTHSKVAISTEPAATLQETATEFVQIMYENQAQVLHLSTPVTVYRKLTGSDVSKTKIWLIDQSNSGRTTPLVVNSESVNSAHVDEQSVIEVITSRWSQVVDEIFHEFTIQSFSTKLVRASLR